MPYPTQISREAIVAAAYTHVERDGVEQLTLAQLAEALGVKAPSLYRHVPSKAALMQLINGHTIDLLFAAYDEATAAYGGDPTEQIRQIMRAHRAFAYAHPITYVLAFTTAASDERPAEQLLEGLARPLQELMAAISGPKRALAALRGALALVHGFAMLEIGRQLRRGGDLNESFDGSVDAYLRGWKQEI